MRSGSRLLKVLLQASEKAANIARTCRQKEALFQLLVQEKSLEEKNPRFFQDFKTLADVLIQETIRHDIEIEVKEKEGVYEQIFIILMKRMSIYFYHTSNSLIAL